MDIEEWRGVTGFEDRYQVSSFGSLRSKSFLKTGWNRGGPFSYWTKPRTLKQNLLKSGYLQVKLYDGQGGAQGLLVHRLVAFAFLPAPRPEEIEVNHKNSKRDCNLATNLEWTTPKGNSVHGFEFGKHADAVVKGSDIHNSVLLETDVPVIRQRHQAGWTLADLGREYGVTYQAISHVINKKNWAHIQ